MYARHMDTDSEGGKSLGVGQGIDSWRWLIGEERGHVIPLTRLQKKKINGGKNILE